MQNDNNLCMPIAIGLCFLKTCKKVDAKNWGLLVRDDKGMVLDHAIKHRVVPQTYYDNILKISRKKMQKEMAMRLCEKARVSINRYLGLNDIEPFENLLGVSINVLSNRVGNKFVRVTDDREKPRLYLYHVESKNIHHWHGVANIQGFFKASYFCHTCLKPYKNKASHSCATSCDVCLHDNCKKTDVQIGCHSCNRICRSLTCFQRHKTQRIGQKAVLPRCL